jgi:diguanylate cyclase (GGDEF)-like protein
MNEGDLLRGLFSDAKDLCVVLRPDRTLEVLNPAFGRTVAGAIEGVDFKDLIVEAARDRVLAELVKAAAGEHVTIDVPQVDVDGRQQVIEYRFFPLEGGLVAGIGRVREDRISDREALQRAESELRASTRMLDEIQLELTQVPFIDPVTGVWNRMQVFERLTSEWSRCERFASPLALLLVDVPGLKAVRARHGATVANDVLKAVARRLKTAVRDHDILGRSTGDQFVIVAVQADYEGALSLSNRVREGVGDNPIQVGDVAHAVGVDIGGATSRSEGVEIMEDLFRVAEEALEDARRSDVGMKVASETSV